MVQKAADQGNVEGMYELGVCYLNGEGIEANKDKAIFWLQRVHASPDGYMMLCNLKPIVTVHCLISERAIDVNAKNKRGNTLLHYAYDSVELARILVSAGTSVNLKNENDETPLDYARQYSGNAEVIAYLESIGARAY